MASMLNSNLVVHSQIAGLMSAVLRHIIGVLVVVGISVPGLASAAEFQVKTVSGDVVPHAVISAGGPLTPGSHKAVMDQIDKAFVPYVLAVPVGASVSFPNSDQVRHHVYSFSEPKSFELRLYSGIPEAPINFDKAGVVVVGCNIHDNMVGYIYISQREHWATTDDKGQASLTIGENTQVFVWHPDLSLDAQTELTFDLSALETDEDGKRILTLDIADPQPYPQAVRSTDRDKFKRFLDP